jgi:AraC-like DNA-binding protein
MDKQPWQEKEEFAASFPFRCWDSALPDFTFPLHWHEYAEIAEVLAGELIVTIDGKPYRAYQGDIVAIDGGQIHGFSRSGGSVYDGLDADGTRLRFFHFDRQLFSKHDFERFDGIGRSPVFSRLPIVRVTRDPPDAVSFYQTLRQTLGRLFEEYRNRESGFRLAVKAGVYETMLLFLRKPGPAEPRGETAIEMPERPASIIDDERLERVITLIFKNFDQFDLDLDTAAREAALSRFHFARFFKGHTGMTFHSYLQMVRLSHAEEFLVKTNLPVTTIAYQCGFASLPTFNRVFKAGAGTSPLRYRERSNRAMFDVNSAIVDR